MSECSRIDLLVTPFVDGELPEAERAEVDRHLHACPTCRARVDVERSMHEAIRTRRAQLCAGAAPPALRDRCRLAAGGARSRPVPSWRSRAMPLALAATLVAALLGAFVYRVTQSPVRLIAAELTTDHLRCFMLHGSPEESPSAGEVEQTLEAQFAWDATLPDRPEQAGLELVGARPCLYAEGRVAHIMYRYQGRPVSVFMLPDRHRAEELVEVMGHHAVIWAVEDRTFVLVAREAPADVGRIARFVHAGLR